MLVTRWVYFDRLVVKTDDDFGRAMLSQNLAFRWLSIRLNSMSTAMTCIVTSWICMHPHQLDPGLTAMVISYSLQVTGCECTRNPPLLVIYLGVADRLLVFTDLQWLINTFTQLEIEMNSIERVKHYSEIDTEAAYTADGDNARTLIEAPRGWPRDGKIVFDRINARYRPELPLVLQDLTFTVNASEKVGVVGRTGSGKSTLMNLLFRIMELDSGVIEIDGVDISKLGLKQLRSAISMLPQDPTLFSGTIRENIDPFEQYTDSQVWAALEKAQMNDALQAMPESNYTSNRCLCSIDFF